MDKRIEACANCGSLNIRAPSIREGGIPGVSEVAGTYYCENCGKITVPIIFNNEKDYKKFLKGTKKIPTAPKPEYVGGNGIDLNRMFRDVKDSLLAPSKAAKDLAGKTRFSEGVVMNIIIITVTILAKLVLGVIMKVIEGIPIFTTEVVSLWAMGVALVIFLVAVIVATLIFSLIYIGLIWFIGKLLGGKAKFADFYGPLVYSTAALYSIIAIVISFGSFSSVHGVIYIVYLILAALGVKALFNQATFTIEAHQISRARAAVAVLSQVPLFLASLAVVGLFLLNFL